MNVVFQELLKGNYLKFKVHIFNTKTIVKMLYILTILSIKEDTRQSRIILWTVLELPVSFMEI